MQHIASVAVSDATLLAPFVNRHAARVDIGKRIERGMWGVGFQRHGEQLVQKGPASRAGRGALGAVAQVRARHLVLAADDGLTGADVGDVQPLRYRDWLFAMSGTETLPASYVADVQQELSTFAFGSKRGATAAEATMMLFMDALYRANARDSRKITTQGIWRGLSAAVERVRALAAGAALACSAILHVPGHAFALALGRPLFVSRYRGIGPAPRARRTLQPHLRGVVITDAAPADDDPADATDTLEGFGAVEVGEDCEPRTVRLAS